MTFIFMENSKKPKVATRWSYHRENWENITARVLGQVRKNSRKPLRGHWESTDVLLWCGELFVGTCLQRGGEKKIEGNLDLKRTNRRKKKKRSQSAFGTNVNVNLPEW